MINPRFLKGGFVLGWMAISCLACAKTHRVPSPVGIPEGFSNPGQSQQPQKWWHGLEDPELNGLIETALSDNLNIAMAWDRLAEADATVSRSRAGLFPTLDADAGASRTFTNAPPPNSEGSNFGLGLTAGYEIDIWGRVRSAKDALLLSAEATQADLFAAAISISAEVALSWYQLAFLQEQLVLIEEQNATNTKMLNLLTIRFRSGQASAADLLQQEQLIESNRGEQVRIQSRIEIETHGLAILLGLPPKSELPTGDAKLISPSPIPATGLPADLIERRPDVIAAHLRVQAADKRTAAAIAERFPRLSVSARLSTASQDNARELFSNWLLNLAANLVIPLIDGGRKKADVDIAKARTSEALHMYGQTVLQSFKEVEDALTEEHHQRMLIESMERQLALSSRVIERIRDNYTKGRELFMRVLDAMLKHQRLQRDMVAAKFDLVRNRIALHRALAGGFELTRPKNGQENNL